MNGLTKYEIATRNRIRELIESSEYTEARQLAKRFLAHSTRHARRRILMHAVKNFLPLLNGELERRSDDN